jgi:hypothetical protein
MTIMPISIQSRRRALVAALLAAVPSLALEAQRVAPILDVGASTVRYADSVSVAATTLSPTLRIESSNATVAASGTLSQIASGGWTAQGTLAASRFVPLGGRFHGELAATAGGSAHQDETRTGQLLAQGRAHFIGSARGLWVGGGLGTTWDGVAAHGLTLVDAGAWLSTGSATVLAAVAPTLIRDVGQPSLRYTDATAAARWVGARAEVGASLGTRLGSDLPTTTGASTWGSVSGALWVAGPVAVAASAGSYPIDYTQGYPGGRFVSLALRLARRPGSKATSGAADASLAAARGVVAPIGPIASFFVGPSADRKHRTIAVRARAATSVEVTGDFTGWQPVRLTRRRDGRWVGTLPIPAGTHEIALRIDGGEWIVPPGLTTIRDEFGGLSGLLVIRE